MIVVDSREFVQHKDIAEKLLGLGHSIDKDTLECGDFLIIGKDKSVLIERKTIWDYRSSLQSGRLIDQLKRLVNVENAEPRILIEGSIALLKKRRKPIEGVMGSIISVIEDWKVPIYWVPSINWTPMWLSRIDTRLGREKEKRRYPIRVHARAVTLNEKIRCVVEGLPKIGPTLAHNLLTHFKTIANIVNATKDNLLEVKKIGGKKATDIVEVLHGTYTDV